MKLLPMTSVTVLFALVTSTLVPTTAAQAANPSTSDPAAATSPQQRDAPDTAENASTKVGHSRERVTIEPETPQTFVNKAAQDGMTEVELGKLAVSRAQSPEVKQFADRMIKDHGQANLELGALATSKSLQVPKKLDAEHQSVVDELSGMSGAQFDAAYAQHMAAAHGKAVALFEGASRLDDGALASFAKKTLPTLKEHKQMADALHMGSPAAATGAAESAN